MVEREWREASDLRTSRLALGIVLVAAAVLRLAGIGHGIPYAVEVDEPEIVERALNMVRAGSLHPHFFDYPGLAIYVQVVVSIARFLFGAISGEWSSLGQAMGGSFYLWGRAVTALFGTVTVLLVYQIGMRWGARHALLAAALMAFLPLHVRYSHFVLTDTLLTFFVTLTFLLSLVAHERGTPASFVWAGAAAGLAAATKYNGGIALMMPLLSCWMTPAVRLGRVKAALLLVAASLAAFLLLAPYTVLDLPAFLDSFARLANEYRVRPVTNDPIWLLYLKYLLRHAFGWPALLLAGAGLVMGIVRLIRGPGRVRWALAVTFTLLYFWMLSTQRIVYARYLLPIAPPLCVLAAAAVVSGVSLLRRYEIPRAPRTALIAGLTIAALFPPVFSSIRSDRDLGKTGTVDQAYAWIVQNVPAGSHLVLESRGLLLPDRYRSQYISSLRSKSYEEWRSDGVDYFVASSASYGSVLATPERSPHEYDQYMRIFAQSREMQKFVPTGETPGPELRIYKVIP